mgnify:FL=1
MRALKRYLFIIFIFGGVLAGVLLLRYNQDLRRLANGPEKVGEIAFSSEKETSLPGDITRVDLLFRTGPDDDLQKISSVAFRFRIPEKDNQKIELVDKDGNPAAVIYPDVSLSNSGEWKFPVNEVLKDEDGVTFDFAAVNLSFSGYESSEYRSLASIYLRVEGEDKIVSDLVMEKDTSSMLTKTRPVANILTIPETAKYIIGRY